MYKASVYRRVAIGIVAENKQRNTDNVEIVPIELFPSAADDIQVLFDKVKATALDQDDIERVLEATRGITLNAEAIKNTNSILPDDVRRGEQVSIYQAADDDKYYWESLGRDFNLRRLETKLFAISGLPDDTKLVLDIDDCYSLEISSHDKHVTFRTSDRNGEAAKYVLQFDLNVGVFSLEDNFNNYMFLKSTVNHWKLQNGDNSLVELNKSIVNIYSDDSINLKSSKINIEGGSSITTKTNTHSASSSSHTTKTGSYLRDAGSSTVKGPTSFKAPIGFPAFACGPGGGAPAGTSGGSMAGDITQSSGKIKTPMLDADSGKVGQLIVDSITWSSASGPLP